MIARGWGMAEVDSLHPGFKNVASLSSLRHVALKFTAYGDVVTSKDELGSRKTYRTYSPDIRVGIPVIKSRLALTAGFAVERSTQYDTAVGRTWYAFDDTLTGIEQFERSGTLFRVPLGAAWQVIKGLSISGTVNLENGTVREDLFQIYQTPNDGSGKPLYEPTGRIQDDSYHGSSLTWSVLLAPFSRLQLAAAWTPAHDVDVDRRLYLDGVSARYNSSWKMKVPDLYRAGIAARIAGRWSIGGDYQLQKYGEFVGWDNWVDQMEDEFTASVGIERKQDQVRRGGFNNLPVRIGASHRQWGYLVGGEPVIEQTLSLGTGFPFRANLGQLDVAFSYSRIGEMAKNGMESTLWRLTISVTGLERWW